MDERAELMTGFLRVVSHHSALRGDTTTALVRAATWCLERGTGTGPIAIAHAPLHGEDLLVAHEIDLRGAASEAGLTTIEPAPSTVGSDVVEGRAAGVRLDEAGHAWMALVGVYGPIAALRLPAPPGGWDDAGADLAFVATVVGELSQALLRHWVENQHLDRSAALLEAQRHTHVGCFEWDIVADKVRWSDELFRIFGDEPQSFEPTFEEFLERIHEDDRDAVRASVYQAYEERRDYRIEERILRPDGTVRQLASWGHVIVDESTVPIKIIGSCQDVTDMRTTLEELTRTERRLAEVQERRARAMELNDNVVQGLAASLYALELGLTEVAITELTGTLRSARTIIGDLLTTSDAELDDLGLTRNEPAPSYLPPTVLQPDPAPAAGATRVIVADDSGDIRLLAAMILAPEADFHVVAEATDGMEVVALVREYRPEMVLLDLAMPVLDGLSAIPEIRAASPDTMIVVFSGFNAGAASAEAIARGATAYVEKGHLDVSLPGVLRRIRDRSDTEAPIVVSSDR